MIIKPEQNKDQELKQEKALPSEKYPRTIAGLETYPFVTAQSTGNKLQRTKAPRKRDRLSHSN